MGGWARRAKMEVVFFPFPVRILFSRVLCTGI